MRTAKTRHIAALATACAMLAFPAGAETMSYTADMTAAAEVPPVDSAATGTAEVTIDTEAKTASWTLKYDGLSGDPSAAHIHGPASATENAKPMVALDPVMEGSADITDEQIGAIQDGMAYVNIHTGQHPDGEIRGQLMKAE